VWAFRYPCRDFSLLSFLNDDIDSVVEIRQIGKSGWIQNILSFEASLNNKIVTSVTNFLKVDYNITLECFIQRDFHFISFTFDKLEMTLQHGLKLELKLLLLPSLRSDIYHLDKLWSCLLSDLKNHEAYRIC